MAGAEGHPGGTGADRSACRSDRAVSPYRGATRHQARKGRLLKPGAAGSRNMMTISACDQLKDRCMGNDASLHVDLRFALPGWYNYCRRTVPCRIGGAPRSHPSDRIEHSAEPGSLPSHHATLMLDEPTRPSTWPDLCAGESSTWLAVRGHVRGRGTTGPDERSERKPPRRSMAGPKAKPSFASGSDGPLVGPYSGDASVSRSRLSGRFRAARARAYCRGPSGVHWQDGENEPEPAVAEHSRRAALVCGTSRCGAARGQN
jgi:hypothetical protein